MCTDGVYAASVGPEPGETFVDPALRAGFVKMLAFDSARSVYDAAIIAYLPSLATLMV